MIPLERAMSFINEMQYASTIGPCVAVFHIRAIHLLYDRTYLYGDFVTSRSHTAEEGSFDDAKVKDPILDETLLYSPISSVGIEQST